MLTDVEALVERRRHRRKLVFWRVAAVVLIALLALSLFREQLSAALGGDVIGRAHIARLGVSGIITSDMELEDLLDDVRKDASVKALILRINSPGGTAAGGEALHAAVARIAETKPVVAVMDETATSAAYMVALAAEHIVARASSVTGSIGVIFQSADFSKLLERIGVTPERIASGEHKARPNPLEPTSPETRKLTEAVVLDIHGQFVRLVADRRGLAETRVRELADGRVFTGAQAKERGLVDALGGEREARAWLEARPGFPRGLPVFEVAPPDEPFPWTRLFRGMAQKALLSESLSLDGLVSLWHPDGR